MFNNKVVIEIPDIIKEEMEENKDILKRVSRNEQVSDQQIEKKLFIHLNSLKTSQSISAYKLNLNGYKCFIVSLANRWSYNGEFMEIQVDERDIDLKVSMKVKAAPGKEEALVKAFCQSENFSEALLGKIRLWIETLLVEHEESLTESKVSIRKIKKTIGDNLKEIGLRAIHLRFSTDTSSEDLSLESDFFYVEPSEITVPVKIKFLTQLKADEERLLSSKVEESESKNLVKKIITDVKEIIVKDIDSDGFFHLFNHGDHETLRKKLDKVMSENGWKIASLDFRFDIDPLFERLTVDSKQPIQVSTSDYTGVLDLNYSAILQVLDSRKKFARFFSKEFLQDEMEDCLRATIEAELTFADLYKLRGASLKTLKTELNKKLAKFGRELRDLRLVPPSISKPADYLTITHKTENCPIEDTDIDIKSEIRLKLVDEAVFMSSGIQDIEKALETRLDHAVAEVVMGLKFPELETGLETGLESDGDEKSKRWTDRIFDIMKDEASSLGYKLTQLIVLPQTWWRDFLRDGFDFTVGDGQDFATSLSGGSVNLKVKVTGKFDNLSKLDQYIRIKKEADFRTNVLEKLALNTLVETLQGITPQEFYTRFRVEADSNVQSKTPSIGDKLQKAIKDKFEALNCSTISVIVEPLQTELIDRLAKLCRGFHEFDFDLGSTARGISGKYTVHGLNSTPQGWYTFHKNQGLFGSSESVKESVSSAVRDITQHIQSRAVDWFTSNYGDEWDANVDTDFDLAIWQVFRKIEVSVSKNFGLAITISDKVMKQDFIDHKIKKQLERKTKEYDLRSEIYIQGLQSTLNHEKEQLEKYSERIIKGIGGDSEMVTKAAIESKKALNATLKEQADALNEVDLPTSKSVSGEKKITIESMKGQSLMDADKEEAKKLGENESRGAEDIDDQEIEQQ